MLPAISLGLWHNFGGVDVLEQSRAKIRRAFDLGITHFDLANNYGPPPGSAEITLGTILKADLASHRDELVISTKAGYQMWPGPYGNYGSRKYLISSLDQSLKRLGLDYVDIFYHHCPDPETPFEETAAALDQIVRQGKALYVGISSYSAAQTVHADELLKALGTPCLIHQPAYHMFNRWIEDGLLQVLGERGIGCIAFSPLAQGLLTGKYLNGIPEGSRASKEHGFLQPKDITEEKINIVRRLHSIAEKRDQTLAQLALSWVLRHPSMTSVLVGASSISQIEDNVAALARPHLSQEEIREIDRILAANAEKKHH